MGAPLPYPFHRWPRLERAQARLRSRIARRLDFTPETRAAAAALSALVGAQVACEPAGIRLVDPVARSEGCPRLVLVIGVEGSEGELLLDLESTLASSIIDRALGGDGGSGSLAGGHPLSPTERGIFAYLAARAMAPCAEGSLRILEVVSAQQRIDELLGQTRVPAIFLDLRVGGCFGAMRLFLPEPLLDRLPPHSPRPLPLELELDMTIELGRARLPIAEFAKARPEDILVPDAIFGSEAHRIPTILRARVEGSSRTYFWIRAEAQSLRVDSIEPSGLVTSPCAEEIRTMPSTHPNTTTRLLETVGDATLELSVEMARVRISLEELAALSEDMILLSGRPLLEPVVLRLGDRPWATGELVDIDGEVGIRLLDIGERRAGEELGHSLADHDLPTRIETERPTQPSVEDVEAEMP